MVRSFVQNETRAGVKDAVPAEVFMKLCDRVDSAGAALAWLASYDEDKAVREYAFMLLFVAAQDREIPREVRRPALRAAGPVLVKAFRSEDVSDDVKYMIGPMASLCGVKIPDADYDSAFKDPEGVRKRKRDEALRSLTSDPEDLDHRLEGAGLLCHAHGASTEPGAIEAQRELAAICAGVNPAPGAALLCVTAAIAVEHGAGGPEIARDLQLAADTHTGEALWYLGEMGRMPSMGAIGTRASELACELAAAGIDPAPAAPGRFLRGHVSIVDGMGSRSLLLLFRSNRHTSGLHLMLNDDVGIKDLFVAFHDADEVEEILTTNPEIVFVRCDLGHARDLVADAFSIHERAGTPAPGRFLLYRHFLGPEPIEARPRTPDLSAYGLEELPRNAELVAGSAELARLPTCRDFYCASDEAYRFVERHLSEFTAKHPSGASSFHLSPEAMQEYLETIAVRELPNLIRRLAVNLEVEAKKGRAAGARNRKLARLYVALSEGVVPYPTVPFMQKLQAAGIQRIADNLDMGYGSQQEVNEAAMKLDEPPDWDDVFES